MPHRRTTFSKFIIEDERRRPEANAELTALLNDIQTACKFVASAVSRGALYPQELAPRESAHEIFVRECEWGGKLCGILSSAAAEPHAIPATYPRGRYLLIVDPLDGAEHLDVNQTVGSLFSVLRAPHGIADPERADFLQPGSEQVAAGLALYGPTATLAFTLGSGVHGFTLDREIGAYTLTQPDLRIAEETDEFAIDAAGERFWEPPVRHYVAECVQGESGPRGRNFRTRWIDSRALELQRILVRGGLFMEPHDLRGPGAARIPWLLGEANPIAMLVEQAGGAATTGRERVLDLQPSSLDERVPLVFGSLREVERLRAYYERHDRGEDLVFATPLFNERSLFRSAK